MYRILVFLPLLSAAACGAVTVSDAPVTSTSSIRVPALTTAHITFMTRGDGKDEDSAVAVQLLNDRDQLAAEGGITNQEFDDRTVSRPIELTRRLSLDLDDFESTRVRVKLTPDGRDEWAFDMRLTARMSDGTERNFFWSGLRLTEDAPETTVTLQSGRMP